MTKVQTLHVAIMKRFAFQLLTTGSGVTLYQGAPGSKFSKAPLVEVLKARVEHRICTSFLGSPGHVHPENF
jgi:hypothetical protein